MTHPVPAAPEAPRPLARRRPRFIGLPAALAAALASACGGSLTQKTLVMQQEDFESTTSHSRSFAASPAQTCEAARRALLSQGYVISLAAAEGVNGRKHFQPDNENHVEVEFRVVCAPEGPLRGSTIAFVSALQDRYALKKTNNSASLGVGALGSVSLPFSSSDDALVKVASETLNGASVYDRFFRLVERYLPAVAALDAEPAPAPVGAPAAGGAAASSSAAAATPAPNPPPASAPTSTPAPAPAPPAAPASASTAPAAASAAGDAPARPASSGG